MSEHINNKFNIIIKVHQCQYLLHHLGFTLQRPIYAFPKVDKKEQQQFIREFKKNLRF
ncbi:MAG: winged helix-turn-helix domain-containing protein [Promethearchaeota archaeon]